MIGGHRLSQEAFVQVFACWNRWLTSYDKSHVDHVEESNVAESRIVQNLHESILTIYIYNHLQGIHVGEARHVFSDFGSKA